MLLLERPQFPVTDIVILGTGNTILGLSQEWLGAQWLLRTLYIVLHVWTLATAGTSGLAGQKAMVPGLPQT